MITYLLIGLVGLVAFIFYRFYYLPKSEIKRYITILKSLGYRVYDMPFAFLGISVINDWDKGIALHKDSQYLETTVYPHIDVAVGNCLDKVTILLTKPQLIKEFLSVDSIYKYPKYQRLIEGAKLSFGVGISLAEGQLWKYKRKIMSKVFNFDFVKDNIEKIGKICDRCYENFDKSHQTENNQIVYDPLELSSKIFNGVMMKCFFGSDLMEQQINGRKIQEFIVQIASLSIQVSYQPVMALLGKLAWNLGMSSKIRLLKEKVQLFREKSKQILKRRTEQIRNTPKPDKHADIIQALIYEKLDNKQEFSYSDEDLIAQFQAFLIAGTDTTSHFYAMAVYYLGKHPHIHEKVRDQINSIIKSDEDITYENIKKLAYLDWFHHEISRYYGPANLIFFRIATQDNTILDIPIKKNTIVNYNSRGNHYSQKYFKKPHEFRPERWQSECEGMDPYAFIGFSAGPRSCIGKQLAYLESKIAIIKLIRRYKTIKVPEEITMGYGLVYEAKPFQVRYTK